MKHAQRFQVRLHGPVERCGGSLASVTQGFRRRLPGLRQFSRFRFQRPQVAVAAFQGGQFVDLRLQQGRQGIRIDLILATGGAQREQALLHRIDIGRVGVQIGTDGHDGVDGLVQFDTGTRQGLHRRTKPLPRLLQQ